MISDRPMYHFPVRTLFHHRNTLRRASPLWMPPLICRVKTPLDKEVVQSPSVHLVCPFDPAPSPFLYTVSPLLLSHAFWIDRAYFPNYGRFGQRLHRLHAFLTLFSSFPQPHSQTTMQLNDAVYTRRIDQRFRVAARAAGVRSCFANTLLDSLFCSAAWPPVRRSSSLAILVFLPRSCALCLPKSVLLQLLPFFLRRALLPFESCPAANRFHSVSLLYLDRSFCII